MRTSDPTSNAWNLIAQRIQAIAQTGPTYANSPYDVERYSELSAIAAPMIAGPEPEKIDLAMRLFASERGYATPKVDVRAAVFQTRSPTASSGARRRVLDPSRWMG